MALEYLTILIYDYLIQKAAKMMAIEFFCLPLYCDSIKTTNKFTCTKNQAPGAGGARKMNIYKKEHGAGGYTISAKNGKHVTYCEAKKKVIYDAIFDRNTEGVYVRTDGKIVRQLLNGTYMTLRKTSEEGYIFK